MLLTPTVCLKQGIFISLNNLWRNRLIIIYDNVLTYNFTQRTKKINNKTPHKSFVRMCKEKQGKKEIIFISEKLLHIFLDWRGKDNSYLLWQWWDLYNEKIVLWLRDGVKDWERRTLGKDTQTKSVILISGMCIRFAGLVSNVQFSIHLWYFYFFFFYFCTICCQ